MVRPYRNSTLSGRSSAGGTGSTGKLRLAWRVFAAGAVPGGSKPRGSWPKWARPPKSGGVTRKPTAIRYPIAGNVTGPACPSGRPSPSPPLARSWPNALPRASRCVGTATPREPFLTVCVHVLRRHPRRSPPGHPRVVPATKAPAGPRLSVSQLLCSPLVDGVPDLRQFVPIRLWRFVTRRRECGSP